MSLASNGVFVCLQSAIAHALQGVLDILDAHVEITLPCHLRLVLGQGSESILALVILKRRIWHI